jgi:RimJ/RimL family protein N-acetyltransferase
VAKIRTAATVSLVTPDLALLDAAVCDRATLEAAIGHDVAEGWNGFPKSLRAIRAAVAVDAGFTSWGVRLFVVEDPRTLVGWGGFKGPPQEGAVELGYEIAPGWAGRGLATQAVRELLREAFGASEVESVVAHTPPEPGPSVRVLEKNGFHKEGEVPDKQIGRAWRFRMGRAEAPLTLSPRR